MPKKVKVSIIIPSFNEFYSLDGLLGRIGKVKIPYQKEIIIVNDGSTDQTASYLRKLKNHKIITNPRNLGKGASIRKALKHVTGDIVIIQDADFEYDPKDYNNLLSPFRNKDVQVVYGSRELVKNPVSHWTFNLGGRLVTKITNLLYKTHITDEPTGYKLFRAKLIKAIKLESRGFEFCPEVTAKIAKRKVKIIEVPISYNPRPISEKKIKWWDGFVAIYFLLKYKFTD
ncbi:MAG: Glycosyl transferase family 2 [Candidatus Curtissbacteria bacterium GW2011_GWA1_40_47]|uniref:Glycosyltransferase 2-like domain-containing protein n=1 Tax=Candidatus Curtissbacteria bacterium RIFOXYA1_FULL_41_14 TaxID=1797737 RepID=A0A1F5HAJ6_9BACT|nr:MAG: Glycosyl transferase family 2 [Candidatus Curtissbacteria bacterium GW2011_GWB1_40_28]KKR62388.1 MAG: Glycosyl transferase family 2 [Microgenomates group bacterium GW2011_GWC1_40_35]KKR66411.1 MAG: Glycosyl transferase family 2 [Candidatus Curtissbacteria bacterium GW2011_GWA1_40_47]KKR77667.1 MAG: Glycosyl transferase family 2 [Candidatus Curtissbacteria bacterium GW2011_GWD1_40_8]KKS02556.1 MAG: Glycosyl transferase family 2 [Candidatus Curtissbacteria bacterium GW2011_GWC2_41_21]OGD